MLITTTYSQSLNLVKEFEFDNILTISSPNSDKYIKDIKCSNLTHLEIEDDLISFTEQDLNPLFLWLNTCKKMKGLTLIHCEMGISRSTACSLIYLIEVERYNIPKAIEYVKTNHRYGEANKIACCPNIKILDIYGNKELIEECFNRLKDFAKEFRD